MMEDKDPSPSFKILIINPNTSTHMTDALRPIVQKLNYNDIQFDYFTAPKQSVTLPDERVIESVPSINSGEDSVQSALHCRPFIEPLIPKYDAFLVACYSAHPLVDMLKSTIDGLENKARQQQQQSDDTETRNVLFGEEIDPRRARKYVTGIFEASVASALMLISSFHLHTEWSHHKIQSKATFGIVTTGAIWKDELTRAVSAMINGPDDVDETNPAASPMLSPPPVSVPRFAGVETTGLNATELHETPPEEVRQRMIVATETLLKATPRPVRAICLGCAGMAGMDEAVRAGCIKIYGESEGGSVHIVDGVVAGVGLLVNACKAQA